MTPQSMGDVLDGSSLIVAILVAFYTLWQADIVAAKTDEIPLDPRNRTTVRTRIKTALWGRTVPLLIVSLVTLLVLAPRFLTILRVTGACTLGSNPEVACRYDDVGALFLLTEALLLGLVVVLVLEAHSLHARLRQIAAE